LSGPVREPEDGAVLVTGGAGYVGSVAVRHLLAAGRPVVVIDDLSTGHREAVGAAELVVGDAGDVGLVRAVLRRRRVRAVLHFAAKALVEESVREPELYDRANRGTTVALLAAAAREGVRAFVLSSTCAVYGVPQSVPIPEDHPRAPVNPYGRSKRDAEDAVAASGIPSALLRYFNAAGGEPEHGLVERHDPETHLIPRALAAARSGAPLTVHGSDYPTPDGTCVRDYVHVGDLAEAHLAALARLEAGGDGGAWNLGTGRGHSVREVLSAVAARLGRPVPSVDGPRREGDPPELVADPSRARRDLGWNPVRSDLERLVRDASWA
jgi:UDP-glucose-4-epimerase GalE